jgi:hypothetical protein
MALLKQNLGRKEDSLNVVVFNISNLLVDKYVNSYQKSSEGSGFLKDKIKTEE